MKRSENPTMSRGDKVAEKVLTALVEKLKAGVNPWRKPWNVCGEPTGNAKYFAVNLFTKQPYSGINAETLDAGYYAGFSQIANHGGLVNKGAKAHFVVWFGNVEKELQEEEKQAVLDFFKTYEGEKKKGTGKYGACIIFISTKDNKMYAVYDSGEVTQLFTIVKGENVFSIQDTSGLDKYIAKAYVQKEEKEKVNKKESGELWIKAYCEKGQLGGFFYDGGDRSFYRPLEDSIHLSARSNYFTNAEFYSTAFHEMTHSTGAEKRLNRVGITSGAFFGSPVYAKEELIAEMGAAMAMGYLGIENEGTKDNSAAYLGSWLQQQIGSKATENALKRLMSASNFAKKAFAYIAKMYEEAKEEKKQEKNKTPEMPLPVVLQPKPEAARVYKQEPKMSDKEIQLLSDLKADLETSGYINSTLIDFKPEATYSQKFLDEARKLCEVKFTPYGISFHHEKTAEQLSLFRAFPNWEGVGLEFSSKPKLEAKAPFEFWVLAFNAAYLITKGEKGKNGFTPEAQLQGYCDYVTFYKFVLSNGANYAFRRENERYDDFGYIDLKEKYESHTTKEIALMVMNNRIKGLDKGELELYLDNGTLPLSLNAPIRDLEKKNCEDEANKILNAKTTEELLSLCNNSDYIDEVTLTSKFIKEVEGNPDFANELEEAKGTGLPYIRYNELYDDYSTMSEQETREYLVDSLSGDLTEKLQDKIKHKTIFMECGFNKFSNWVYKFKTQKLMEDDIKDMFSFTKEEDKAEHEYFIKKDGSWFSVATITEEKEKDTNIYPIYEKDYVDQLEERYRSAELIS